MIFFYLQLTKMVKINSKKRIGVNNDI